LVFLMMAILTGMRWNLSIETILYQLRLSLNLLCHYIDIEVNRKMYSLVYT
jgi:hypothetical protein